MGRIQLKSVTKSFGDVQVIPPLDLTIEDGEFTSADSDAIGLIDQRDSEFFLRLGIEARQADAEAYE